MLYITIKNMAEITVDIINHLMVFYKTNVKNTFIFDNVDNYETNEQMEFLANELNIYKTDPSVMEGNSKKYILTKNNESYLTSNSLIALIVEMLNGNGNFKLLHGTRNE